MSSESTESIHLPVGTELPGLTEDQARDLVNVWSTQGFFRLRNMGDKIFVTELLRGVAYTVHLQTQYERRTIRKAQTPFRGGPVDDRGRAPTPWEMSVRSPTSFEERTDIVPIPHTERVQVCPGCQGQRRVTCSTCLGTGQTRCGFCGGSGIVQSQVMEPARDHTGKPIMVPRMVQRPCHCGTGLIVCTTCQGSRFLTCPTCTGSGAVKTFDELVVRFQVAAKGELIDVTPVPDKWLAKRGGVAVLDVREPRIERWEKIPDAAEVKVQELIERSHAVDASEYRILLQHLQVECIPIQEVRYKYAGAEKQLWICGSDQAIYAPAAPWSRSRMYGLFAAIVVPIGILITWLIIRNS